MPIFTKRSERLLEFKYIKYLRACDIMASQACSCIHDGLDVQVVELVTTHKRDDMTSAAILFLTLLVWVSLMQIFDPTKDYGSYTIHGDI